MLYQGNNLILIHKVGNSDWQKISDDSIVCSGVIHVSAGTVQLRFDGGAPITSLTNSIVLPFQHIDLSRIEFYGVGTTNIQVWAGTW